MPANGSLATSGEGARPVRVIGITGGIGSGKTTVAGWYHTLGVPVIDADAISRALTAPNGEALPAIREAFGATVFHNDGTLDRAALANRVFTEDPAPRTRLNALLHPMIILRVTQALQTLRAAGEPVVLLDVPLLFETGMDKVCDAVLCVTAPDEVRLQRIERRDGISSEEAVRRIRNQNATERTESLADYVLHTDVEQATLKRLALDLWRRILADGPQRTPT